MKPHITITRLLLPLVAALVPVAASAGQSGKEVATASAAADSPTATPSDSVLFVITDAEIAPEARLVKESRLGHFAWGIDAGSSVDITCNDMTTIDLHAYFGYKGPWLNFLGAGAGINAMINNGSRCYPVYMMLRTSFCRQPQLCFLDLRAGVSFNSIMDNKSQTDFYGTLGVGLNLATGRKFSSHLIVSYNYMPLRHVETFEPPICTTPPSASAAASDPPFKDYSL